jgi:hypothetical protein
LICCTTQALPSGFVEIEHRAPITIVDDVDAPDGNAVFQQVLPGGLGVRHDQMQTSEFQPRPNRRMGGNVRVGGAETSISTTADRRPGRASLREH